MIRLMVKGHHTMCAGYNYNGYASYDGRTVKEVLEEIKEYSKDKGNYIGDGFGNPKSHHGNAWGIRINDIPYVGNWCGWENKYNHQYDNWIVTKVRVNGGWYCFYDFNIECKHPCEAR